MTNHTNLTGKVALITGASAGVGAECARLFARCGCSLVLIARGEDSLAKIAQELSSQTKVITKAMNVADFVAAEELKQQIESEFGQLHFLINNAGLHHRGELLSQSATGLADMVDVNLRAPIYHSRLFAPLIQQSGGGAIVMIGSLAGRTPLQGAATYSATKAGVRAFSFALRDELVDKGIHVGVVSPGPIDTGFIMDEIDKVEDIVYSQPMSTAQQVAEQTLRIAIEKVDEVAMPWASGKLTTLSYLFPSLRRGLRNTLYKIGRKNKQKYKKRMLVNEK